jgi:hypothetical protein
MWTSKHKHLKNISPQGYVDHQTPKYLIKWAMSIFLIISLLLVIDDNTTKSSKYQRLNWNMHSICYGCMCVGKINEIPNWKICGQRLSTLLHIHLVPMWDYGLTPSTNSINPHTSYLGPKPIEVTNWKDYFLNWCFWYIDNLGLPLVHKILPLRIKHRKGRHDKTYRKQFKDFPFKKNYSP